MGTSACPRWSAGHNGGPGCRRAHARARRLCVCDRTKRGAMVRRQRTADGVARHTAWGIDWCVQPQEAVRRAQPLTPVLSTVDSTAQTRRDVNRGQRHRSHRRGRTRTAAALVTDSTSRRPDGAGAAVHASVLDTCALAARACKAHRVGRRRVRSTRGVRAFHAAAMIAVPQAGTTQEAQGHAARRSAAQGSGPALV